LLIFAFYDCNSGEGGEGIFAEKLKEVLLRNRKDQTSENQNRLIDKLEKHERLTDEEFWSVYASIKKSGPEVRYPNPQNYANYEFTQDS